jgi:mannose-6-phosphate isomerase-like protein (cupin superfamily)
MKATFADMLARLRGPASPGWPDGERFAEAFHHGSMSVELYVPRRVDPQQPHTRDELYVIARGHGRFVRGAPPDATREAVGAGDVLFVPAGQPHRFEDFSDDFATWVAFYGPAGGESP